MDLTLGFSSCPNDTFIFDGIVNSRLSSGGLSFIPTITDIEQLNEMAVSRKLDISKVSVGVLPEILEDYQILDSGAALGFGCGPLVVSLPDHSVFSDEKSLAKVAIPGKHTTANLLFSMAFPDVTYKVPYLFSEIEEAVLSREVDAGLIIHENRFTYLSKGLVKIIDLGEWWEKTYAVPVPLGCIVVRKSFPENLKKELSAMLRKSVIMAMDFNHVPMPFVRLHAQAMDPEIMMKHIQLYVNDYSVSLGKEGREAIVNLIQQQTGKNRQIQPENKWFIE